MVLRGSCRQAVGAHEQDVAPEVDESIDLNRFAARAPEDDVVVLEGLGFFFGELAFDESSTSDCLRVIARAPRRAAGTRGYRPPGR
jgi:hypothetical protein